MLAGALYVLDEASVGLHPRDTRRLVETLQNLKALGNYGGRVEHDPESCAAPTTSSIWGRGPAIMEAGLVYEGDYPALTKDQNSLKGRYLGRRAENPVLFSDGRTNGPHEILNAESTT